MMRVPWQPDEWRRALVYGLGRSGLAATRLLRSRGVEVIGVDRSDSTDLAELAADAGFFAHLGADPETLPVAVDGVVVSPGVPWDAPLLVAARHAGTTVVSEVELGFAEANGPVIGITGSNGKSTTTALTGALLESAGLEVEVCGNIGRPLTDCVDGPPGRVFVTEVSSFQLETVDHFRPRAAALLNLSADHLDRHGDLAGYLAAKTRIFERQEPGDQAVLNADDPIVAALTVRARKRFFSSRDRVADGCWLDDDRVMESSPGKPERELFRRGDVGIPGSHNLENAMAASLLARALDADPGGFPRALGVFVGLPHRLEKVRELDGVLWYDDSKGTNMAATLKSLEGFADGTLHLILGGRVKGADPRELSDTVARKARRVYLIGESASDFARALEGIVPIEMCGDLQRAVAAASELAERGEVVLLSPACSSFDQYVDFARRGDHFHELVGSLDA